MKWETVIKPKELGWVNLKLAKEMNWVLLAKVVSRLLTSEGEVWAEITKEKYEGKMELTSN